MKQNIYIKESLYYTPETNTTLQIKNISRKNKINKKKVNGEKTC